MIDKKKLIEWLQKDSVTVLSADIDGVPDQGEVITLIATNTKPEHNMLEGATRPVIEEPTEEQRKAKEEEAKRVQEGWGE